MLRRYGTIIKVVLVMVLICTVRYSFAQGDGPKTMLLTPKNFTVVNPVYMRLTSNINTATNIRVNDAKLTMDVVPFSVLYSFAIKHQFAQVFFTPNWVNIDGKVNEMDTPNVSGFGDPFVALRVGLIGAPALNLKDYMNYKQGFQLYALVGSTIPLGEYDSSNPINVGANRWGFRFSLPMVFNFKNHILQKSTLEVTPSVKFFTKNSDIYGGGNRYQDPLLTLESHFAHTFSKKMWGSLDLGYQYGGNTRTNGSDDDNTISQVGGGVSLGYQIMDPLTFAVSYGSRFTPSDTNQMLRGSLVLIIPSKKDIRSLKKME